MIRTAYRLILFVLLLLCAWLFVSASAAEPIAAPADEPPRARKADAGPTDDQRPPLAGPRRKGHRQPPARESEDREMQGEDDEPSPPDDVERADDRRPEADRQRGDRRGFGRRPGRDGRPPAGRPGGGDGARDSKPPWWDDGPLPPEAIDHIMQVLKTELPRWHDRLARLRERNPRRFENGLRMLRPMMREFMMLREHNPELARTVIDEFKIEEELRELSKQFRKADSDETRRAELEGKVEPLVRRAAELRMQRREARLKFLERRLNEERDRLAQDRAGLEEHIRHFIDRIKSGQYEGTMRERMRDMGGRPGERAGGRIRDREPGEDGDDAMDGPPRRRPRVPREDRPRGNKPDGDGPPPKGERQRI